MDGAKITTLNANAPLQWQSPYTSPAFAAGDHTVVFKHAGPSGTFIDVDALRIFNPDLLIPGDVTGFSAVTGTNNGSINLSWIAPADDAGNNASGPVAAYLVKYSSSPFTSWSDGTLITTGLPAPAAPGAAQSMTVSGLNPGTLYYFAIRAQDEQPNLSANYVTASATAKSPTPMGAGTYDDTHAAWTYSGSWTAYSGAGPANNTMHYTNTVGDSASFTFNGMSFICT